MAKKKMAKSRKIDLSSDAWIGDVMRLSPKQIQMIKDRVNKVTRTKWWSKSTRIANPKSGKSQRFSQTWMTRKLEVGCLVPTTRTISSETIAVSKR